MRPTRRGHPPAYNGDKMTIPKIYTDILTGKIPAELWQLEADISGLLALLKTLQTDKRALYSILAAENPADFVARRSELTGEIRQIRIALNKRLAKLDTYVIKTADKLIADKKRTKPESNPSITAEEIILEMYAFRDTRLKRHKTYYYSGKRRLRIYKVLKTHGYIRDTASTSPRSVRYVKGDKNGHTSPSRH